MYQDSKFVVAKKKTAGMYDWALPIIDSFHFVDWRAKEMILLGNTWKSYEIVGKKYWVSKQRVHQIIDPALKLINEELNTRAQ